MPPSITRLRELLHQENAAQAARNKKNVAKGRFGEILVESWLNSHRYLDFQTIDNSRGTRRDLLNGNGKRPDFLVYLPPEIPAIAIDAKFHTLGAEQHFWIDNEEYRRYKETLNEWTEVDCLFFALIPAEVPNCILLIGEHELIDEPLTGRKVFSVTNTDNRTIEISEDEYSSAFARLRAERLNGEPYDVSGIPAYPARLP